MTPEALLRSLLERWRTSWDPRLSALIQATGEKIEPLQFDAGKTNKARVAMLLAAAADPVTRSSVLAEVELFAEQLSTTNTLASLGELIETLGTAEPDPRIGSTLLRLLHVHREAAPRTVLLKLMRALWPHFDTGHQLDAAHFPRIPSLEGALARARRERKPLITTTEEQLAQFQAQLKEWRTPPNPRPTGDFAGEAELIERIIAAPDDDGARHVYADWLTERGRKMGELIELELATDNRGRARRTALLKELRVELSAQFGGGIHLPSAKRARGFVIDATLEGTQHPLVALLEVLNFEKVDRIAPGSRFNQLRRAHHLTVDQVIALLPLAPRLDELDFSVQLRLQPRAVEQLARCEQSVRVVHCHGGLDDAALRTLWRTKLLARTQHLLLGRVSGIALFELVRDQPRALKSVTFLDDFAMCWVLSREGERFDRARGAFLGTLTNPRDIGSFLDARSARFSGEASFEVGQGRPDIIKAGLTNAGTFGGRPFQLVEPTADSTFELIKQLES